MNAKIRDIVSGILTSTTMILVVYELLNYEKRSRADEGDVPRIYVVTACRQVPGKSASRRLAPGHMAGIAISTDSPLHGQLDSGS